MANTDLAQLRLLQLSSATLPIGSYAFSHGMEYAIEAGWLKTPEDIEAWLSTQLARSLAYVDIPVLMRIHNALADNRVEEVHYWNHFVLACRETRELRLTDTAMAAALSRLLSKLSMEFSIEFEETSVVTLFAYAIHSWDIEFQSGALGYVWSWLENQLAAATKLLPLGQSRAQQLLSSLQLEIPKAIDVAGTLQDEQLGSSLPALAIASMQHESQYTRLFRS